MMDTLIPPTRRRTRISPVERAAKATSDAMRIAAAALVEYVPGLTDDQARAVLLAVRGALVPGVKMEIGQ